jgi:hypothetical protein
MNATPRQTRRSPHRATRRGFTLVELGVSSAIVGMLMVSLASVVVVSAKALPEPGSPADRTGQNTSALELLAGELRCAVEVISAQPGSVEFRVADRDGDKTPETIRYAWAGAGSPLTREYNGAAAVPVSGPLTDFAISYSRRSRTETATTATTWNSGEVLFSSFTGWSGLIAVANTFSATSANWAAQTFAIDRVSFPADTSRVVITRASVIARSAGTSASPTYTVGIHPPASSGSSIPAVTPIGTPITMNTGSLTTSFAWVDVPLNVTLPDTSTRWILVVKGSGTSSVVLRYLSISVGIVDPYFWRSTANSGSSWTSELNTADAPFFIYGYYERPETSSTSVTAYNLSSARISLRPAGGDTWLYAAAEALNKPTVPAP